MDPESPTIQPLVVVGNTMLYNVRFGLKDVARVQVTPPSSVFNTTPESPTAQPIAELTNATEWRAPITPPLNDDVFHVEPPSVVTTEVPAAPTATALPGPIACTA